MAHLNGTATADPSSDAAAISGVARQAEAGATAPQTTELAVNGDAAPAPGPSAAISEEEAALYDRQLRLWGLEAQNRMRNGSVLVVNFRGLATEVCKNIALAGVGSMTILDDRDVAEEDLGADFFLRQEDRVVAARDRILILNPRVDIVAETDRSKLSDDEWLSRFTIVCLTDADVVTALDLNERCRRLRRPFYYGCSLGMHGFVFADLLDHQYLIDRERTLGSGEIRKESVKREQAFVSLSAALSAPWPKLSAKKMRKVSKMMWALVGLFEFQRTNQGMFPADASAVPQLAELTKAGMAKIGVDPALLPSDELLEEISETSTCEFVPVCALVGAILSQDVLNAVGGKEDPIVNFFVWDGHASSGDIYALGLART